MSLTTSELVDRLLVGLDDSPEETERTLDRLAALARDSARPHPTPELQLEVAKAAAAGITWTQIARALGVERAQARDDFMDWAAFRRLRKEAAR